MFRGAFPVMVARPTDPEKALALAKVALERNDIELFQRLPERVGEGNYTFVGWLSLDGRRVVNEAGETIDELKAGDSLVTERQVKFEPTVTDRSTLKGMS